VELNSALFRYWDNQNMGEWHDALSSTWAARSGAYDWRIRIARRRFTGDRQQLFCASAG
jgi:hypothetical protein